MPTKVTTKTVTVTPELAKSWLLKNRENRVLRVSWVAYLARQMHLGNWLENGDTSSTPTGTWLTAAPMPRGR